MLKEYEDISTHIFIEMKGIKGELSEMNIELYPEANPIKK
jgi:hypothetical protein